VASEDPQTAIEALQIRPRLPHVPRLSIGYLLFATAVTAAVFSAPSEFVEGPLRSSSLAVIDYATRCLSGAILAGCFLIVWHAARKTLWPLEPGEWLVVVAGSSHVIWTVVHPFLPDGTAELSNWYGGLLCLVFLGMAMLRVAVAAVIRPRAWMAVLLLDAIVFLWIVLYYAAMALMSSPLSFLWTFGLVQYVEVLGGVAVLLLVIRDWRRASPRHWLHWLGVGSFATSAVLYSVQAWLV